MSQLNSSCIILCGKDKNNFAKLKLYGRLFYRFDSKSDFKLYNS